jgi:LPXTG-motif cell wall-anchored protein
MRTRTRIVAALAAIALPSAAAVALLVAPPAGATTGDCHTYKITNTRGSVTTSGGGAATIAPTGLIMSTPTTPAKVTVRRDLRAPVPLSAITRLSYTTDRQPEATGDARIVAAYKLGVDANGDGTVDGVLVYEPLYNGDVTEAEQTHQALGVEGAGKWWYSAEPGNKQTLATFAAWSSGTGAVAFPAPEARWFAVEQGTWNAGAITLVDDIVFAAAGVCKRVTFCPPPVTSSPTSSPSASASTSPSASSSATTRPPTTPATTAPTTSRPPSPSTSPSDPTPTAPAPLPDNDDDELALTGSSTAYTAGGAAVLLIAGGALLYLVRKRRTRYVA